MAIQQQPSIASIKSSQYSPKVMIVLGSKIHGSSPSPALQNRLDLAGELAQYYPQSTIIVTGGLDHDANLTEAEVMAQYLQQYYAIQPQRIIMENKSTSTYLNLDYSIALLQQIHMQPSDQILLISNDFHLIRAQKIAKKLGFHHTIIVAAPTPYFIRYHSWLREYFAFLSGFILQEY